MNYLFHDLDHNRKSSKIDLLFPGFEPARECVVVISPHDDDALLGAGYLIGAALEGRAKVKIIIVCDGRAGYSKPEDKKSIVQKRKKESWRAYRILGLSPDDLCWLDVPDFSAIHYLGWVLPGGKTGIFGRLIPLLRSFCVTRLIIPNGHREHIDHTAGHLAGVFFGPQAGDAVIADWGQAEPIRSSLVYSVWADFPPRPGKKLAADRAITAPKAVEEKVMAGLHEFKSQALVIAGLVEARKRRHKGGKVMELYQTIDPRPRLDFRPYWERVGDGAKNNNRQGSQEGKT